jgi:hypothetical protein
MAQTLTDINISLDFSGTTTKVTEMLFNPADPFEISQAITMTNGIGSNQANFVWADVNSVGRNGSKTYDLTSGDKDVFNNSMNFQTLKALVIKNTGNSQLEITTNGIGFIGGTSEKLILNGQSPLVLNAPVSGWDISAGTADTITLTNTSSEDGTSFEFMVLGVAVDENSSSSSSYSSVSPGGVSSSSSSSPALFSSSSSSSSSESSSISSASSESSSFSSISSLSSPSSESSSPSSISSSNSSSSQSIPVSSSSSSSSSLSSESSSPSSISTKLFKF